MNISEKENVERIPEVNLLELTRRLMRKLGDLFSWLGKILLVLSVFIVRKSFWILGFILIGVLIGFLHSRLTDKYYTSEFTTKCNIDILPDLIPNVNKLHNYCLENNTVRLEDILGLDNSVVNRIRDIEAFWIIDVNGDEIPDYVDYLKKHDVRDTLNPRLTDRFCVRIKTYDQEDFTLIRDGILGMISSDDIYARQNDMRLRAIRENLAVVSDQIQKLDSLENVKYFQNTSSSIPSGGQIVFLEEQETELFHNDVFSLYSRKQLFEIDLEINPGPITLIGDLTYPNTEDNSLMFYIIKWIWICLIIGFSGLVIYHNRLKLRTVFRENL